MPRVILMYVGIVVTVTLCVLSLALNSLLILCGALLVGIVSHGIKMGES